MVDNGELVALPLFCCWLGAFVFAVNAIVFLWAFGAGRIFYAAFGPAAVFRVGLPFSVASFRFARLRSMSFPSLPNDSSTFPFQNLYKLLRHKICRKHTSKENPFRLFIVHAAEYGR